jgi:membrane-bound lytic murein transglycosylase MltF
MQLMPVTQSEIMEELGIGDRYMPQQNLQAGIYYFSKLMDLFKGARSEDRLALALAAYNAGPGRVYDAQKLAAYLNEDPNSWASISIVLPLLSVRYSSLHQSVWDSGHPSSGHFGSAKQTIQYVAQVMKSYRLYASADFASGNLASR